MKNLLIAASCALALFAACTPAAERLQTGDLIFVGIPADYDLDADSMGSAIADATGGQTGLNRIHTAIAEVDADGQVWIIDATIKYGVDRHPLDTFLRQFTLRDGSLPTFEVKRLCRSRTAGDGHRWPDQCSVAALPCRVRHRCVDQRHCRNNDLLLRRQHLCSCHDGRPHPLRCQ